MANRIPRQGLSLKEIRDQAAAQLAQGLTPESIVIQLIERGWPEQSARRFVIGLLPAPGAMCAEALGADALGADAPEQRHTLKDDYKCMLRGLLCVVLGFVIIAVGLGMREVSNGIFHFTMGVLLIVFEAHDFATGLGGWFRRRNKQ